MYNNKYMGRGLGRKDTDEIKKRKSEAAKKYKIHNNFYKNHGGMPWNVGSNRDYKLESKRIKTVQIDIDTDRIIKIWNCMEDAEIKLKINNITAVCKGHYGRKSAGGYKWKYLSDISEEELNKGYVQN